MHPHVVRFELVRRLQQEFGVRQDAETYADVGQQPHGFHVMRYLPEKPAAQVLRLEQLALAHEIEDDDERPRQLFKMVNLGFHLRRLPEAPAPGQDIELAPPTRHQRRVEPARLRIRP